MSNRKFDQVCDRIIDALCSEKRSEFLGYVLGTLASSLIAVGAIAAYEGFGWIGAAIYGTAYLTVGYAFAYRGDRTVEFDAGASLLSKVAVIIFIDALAPTFFAVVWGITLPRWVENKLLDCRQSSGNQTA